MGAARVSWGTGSRAHGTVRPDPDGYGAIVRSPARLRGGAAAVVAVGAALACCGGGDEDLLGMSLVVESEQPFARAEDLRPRLRRILVESSEHVGLDPDRLDGMRLRIVDGGIACGGLPDARGCYRRDEITVSTVAWLTTDTPVRCVEDTPLPHELLHARIADPGHEDERWTSPGYWTPLRDRLRQPECSPYPASFLW